MVCVGGGLICSLCRRPWRRRWRRWRRVVSCLGRAGSYPEVPTNSILGCLLCMLIAGGSGEAPAFWWVGEARRSRGGLAYGAVVMSMFGSSSSVFCSAGCLFRGACMVAHASSGAGLPADPASVAVSAAHAADARCSNHGRSSSVVMVRHHMLQNLPQPACITPRMSVGLRAMRFYAAARTPSTKFCLDLGRTECFSMSGLLHLPCARCELCERVQKSVQLRPG